VKDGIVAETLDRQHIWLSQTPQTFNRDILMKALNYAEDNNIVGTDESALVEMMGGKIKIIEGPPENIKITNQQDWKALEVGIID
jgi:2-C-methyl-D-erythritol 4-phosphate cytidylyltransferase